MKTAFLFLMVISLVLVIGFNTPIYADGPIVSSSLERSLAYKNHLYINQGKNLVVVEEDDPKKVKCVFELDDYITQLAFNNSTTSLYSGPSPTAGPDYLFVVIHSGVVEIIDISDPNNLQGVYTIGASMSNSKAQYVMAAGDKAYITDSLSYMNWNLRIFDINNPAAPSLLGQTNLGNHYGQSLGGQIRAIDPNNIVFEIPGVLTQVQNVSDPLNISHVFTFFTPGNGGLITRGQTLYLTNIDDWVTSLQIWDMADPGNPGFLGSIPNVNNLLSYSSSISLMDKDGQNYLLLGATDMPHEWLVVINVTDPTDPDVVRITRLQSPTGDVVPYDIDMVGNEALISGWNMPFPGPGRRHRYRYYIVRMDMTNPADPQWVSTVEIPSLFVIDQGWEPLGHAVITPDNVGGLVVSNIGITGNDGAHFDGTECTDTCDEVVGDFDAEGYDLGNISAYEQFGGQFSLLGIINDPVVVSLAELTLNSNAGSLEVSVDYSAMGSTNVGVEVYNGDSLVNNDSVPAGGVVGVISAADGPMPQLTGFKCGYLSATSSFVPIGLFGIILEFDRTCRFTPTAGIAMNGNKLCLIADGASATVSSFSGVEIRGTNLDPFTITNMEWVYAPICGDDKHPYPQADFNEDCHVNMKDFSLFALKWLQCNAPDCN